VKPLSEWTETELMDVMLAFPDATVTPQESLAELLRRERERVAKAMVARWAEGRDEHRGWADAADFVREMK